MIQKKKKKSHRHQTYRKSEAGFRVRMMLESVESCFERRT